jgi:hydrogenase maturation protease
MSRSLVLGLGNPILGDDSIGFRLAELLSARLAGTPGTEFLPTSLAGIRLLDEIPGFDRLIVIDSIATGRCEPGTMTRMGPEDLPACSGARISVHHVPFNELMEIGRAGGLHMPEDVSIYAIEIEYPQEAGAGLSPCIGTRVEEYAEEIIRNEFAQSAVGRPGG